jgi:YggT family protein
MGRLSQEGQAEILPEGTKLLGMLIQIFSLLLQVAVGLVAGTCLLRMYMHLMRINLSARAGNPLAPFVFAMTNWLVLPLRRSVPAIGRLDTASLLAAYALVLAKFVLLGLMMGHIPYWVDLLVMSGLELLNLALSSLVWLVLIYAMLSWVRAGSDVGYALGQLVEPMLQPLRRVIPQIGGVDLSPLALLVLLQVLEIVLHHLSA